MMAVRKLRSTSDLIDELQAEANEYLLSPGEVSERLADIAASCGFTSLGTRISVQEVVHEWGTCAGSPVLRDKLSPDTPVEINLFLDGKEGSAAEAEVQRVLHRLLEAMKAVWAKAFRNAHGGLYLKDSGANDKFTASIRRVAQRSEVFALTVAYLDIDHLKDFNDKCTHEEGDRALRHVYAAMHRMVRDLNGLAFFDGGDEFLVVLPTSSRVQIADGLWKLRADVRSVTFGQDSALIGMTAGVLTRSVEVICGSIRDVKVACEELTKSEQVKKEKKRGTVTFEPQPGVSLKAHPVGILPLLMLGVVVSRSRQYVVAPFGDARLNLIAFQVQEVVRSGKAVEEVRGAVDEVLEWFGSTLNFEADEGPLISDGFSSPTVSIGAVAVAVQHGLAKAESQRVATNAVSQSEPTLAIRYSTASGRAAALCDGKPAWGEVCEDSAVLSFGPLVLSGIVGTTSGAVVGVQIGFENAPRTPGGNELPASLLLTHVTVDDRPRTGGGLPDFWQVAVAEIVSQMGRSQPSSKVLIWGTAPEETETYRRLSGLKDWSVDEVCRISGLTMQEVLEAKKSLPERIEIVRSSDEMLDRIYNAFQSYVGGPGIVSGSIPEHSVLKRAMTEATPLLQSDGVTCDTAALAYPIAIDTLRKAGGVRLSRDDSDQEQKEIIAFKLKLRTPQLHRAPKYLADQMSELDAYAQAVLLDEHGLIRGRLEESEQVDVFVAHLASYLLPEKSTRSTRRACLIVPHFPETGVEPRPLGLISVWATPRSRLEAGRLLDFVFVWRTVEAFIGLPYSLYGSIRFAEQLIDQIAKKANLAGTAMQPQLGELTYIAMSLHLGSDEYHSRVAKHIVDLAAD